MPEKSTSDKATDGAGNKIEGENTNDSKSQPGSDNSDRKQTEGKQGADPNNTSDKKDASGEGKKPETKTTPKTSDADNEDDSKILNITQGQLNDMMAKRADRARREADEELKQTNAKLEEVTKERDTYRAAEVEKVKKQFE